eukprot:scaffold2274_cov67-Phaeocystis_antarctica.AAC.1
MNARRGGRGGHAVSVRADTALPQVWRRVKPGTFLGQDSHLFRRFATATATNMLRHTSTHNQINTRDDCYSADELARHTTQSWSQGHLDEVIRSAIENCWGAILVNSHRCKFQDAC